MNKQITIPVVEEQLAVGKREVQRGGARIHTFVTERPVEESVSLHEEHVSVERRPVDRAATDADFQNKDITMTETAEEAAALLDALPFGQAELMDFTLIPIGPLTPLGRLIPADA